MVQQQANWMFDYSHSKIGFSVRHFGISETEGYFRTFEGKIYNQKEDFSDAAIELNIDVNSIQTQDDQRDGHLKSADFFNAEQHPHIHFKSTSVEVIDKENFKLHGDLTMLGITKSVTLEVEFAGIVPKDPFGNTKAGFLVEGKINRKDWGIVWNRNLDFGGVAVGETVKIKCQIELQKS